MKSYLFPGQGSQRVGMGEGLFDAFPEITAAADAILGRSIKELCLEDPARELGQTQFTQPALYVVNALTYRQRLKETGARPDFVAGHSVGEYNALESAGAMRFDDGLRLVKKRGELMSTAPKGAMAAVIGIPADLVSKILEEGGLGTIDVANYNAGTQTIISGLEADIRDAQAAFERHQAMYIPLNVGGAFHSRYMRPVREAFGAYLDGFTFSAPAFPVIANVDAQPYRPDALARTLTEQITSSVRWLDSMTYLLEQGVTDFIELGPGDVLTKLMRSIKSQFKPGAERPSPTERAAAAPAPVERRAASLAAVAGNARTPQEKVADWNRTHPVGSQVRVAGYDQPLTTKSPATVLFGHRAALYMQGYNGYFALDDVEPVEAVADPA